MSGMGERQTARNSRSPYRFRYQPIWKNDVMYRICVIERISYNRLVQRKRKQPESDNFKLLELPQTFNTYFIRSTRVKNQEHRNILSVGLSAAKGVCEHFANIKVQRLDGVGDSYESLRYSPILSMKILIQPRVWLIPINLSIFFRQNKITKTNTTNVFFFLLSKEYRYNNL